MTMNDDTYLQFGRAAYDGGLISADLLQEPVAQALAKRIEAGELSPAAAVNALRTEAPGFFKRPSDMTSEEFQRAELQILRGIRAEQSPGESPLKGLDWARLSADERVFCEGVMRQHQLGVVNDVDRSRITTIRARQRRENDLGAPQ
jgi:hypothetical protein